MELNFLRFLVLLCCCCFIFFPALLWIINPFSLKCYYKHTLYFTDKALPDNLKSENPGPQSCSLLQRQRPLNLHQPQGISVGMWLWWTTMK